jgi:hypothetical protein
MQINKVNLAAGQIVPLGFFPEGIASIDRVWPNAVNDNMVRVSP